MKCFLFLFILFHFSVSSSFSQNSVLIKTVNDFPLHQNIIYSKYFAGQILPIKSFYPKQNDSILISDFKVPGLYFLANSESIVLAEFIYNPTETLSITLNNSDLQNGILQINNSKENICYNDLKKINFAYDRFLDSLLELRSNVSLTESNYYKTARSLDSIYKKVAHEKNARLTTLQFYYANTYTSQFIIPFYLVPLANTDEIKTYDTPYSYLVNNFFKYIRINEFNVNQFSMYVSINKYLSLLSIKNELEIIEGVNYLLKSFKQNEFIYKEVKRHLVQNLLDNNLPKIAWQVLGESQINCPTPTPSKILSENIYYLDNGNQMEDLVLNNVKNQPVSLKQTCATKKETILLFWQDDCSNTDTLIAEIKKKTNVNIMAIYLGNNKKNWKKMIEKYQIKSWINVLENKPITESNLVSKYIVAGTPIIYLLDSNRKIINKIYTRTELNNWLNQK